MHLTGRYIMLTVNGGTVKDRLTITIVLNLKKKTFLTNNVSFIVYKNIKNLRLVYNYKRTLKTFSYLLSTNKT